MQTSTITPKSPTNSFCMLGSWHPSTATTSTNCRRRPCQRALLTHRRPDDRSNRFGGAGADPRRYGPHQHQQSRGTTHMSSQWVASRRATNQRVKSTGRIKRRSRGGGRINTSHQQVASTGRINRSHQHVASTGRINSSLGNELAMMTSLPFAGRPPRWSAKKHGWLPVQARRLDLQPNPARQPAVHQRLFVCCCGQKKHGWKRRGDGHNSCETRYMNRLHFLFRRVLRPSHRFTSLNVCGTPQPSI